MVHFPVILVDRIVFGSKLRRFVCTSTKLHTVMAFPKDSSTGFVCMILSSQIFTAANVGSLRSKFETTWLLLYFGCGPPPSKSGKWVLVEIPYWTCNNFDGHCYREGAWGGHNQVVHGVSTQPSYKVGPYDPYRSSDMFCPLFFMCSFNQRVYNFTGGYFSPL